MAVRVTIPDYEAVMLPMLQLLRDRNPHSAKEVRSQLAEGFQLTPEEAAQLQPSGHTPLFSNRVHWARLYLDRAGLIENASRGVYRITQRGLDFLATNPAVLNADVLLQFPGVAEFLSGGKASGVAATKAVQSAPGTPPSTVSPSGATSLTPDEALDQAYRALRGTVESQLLGSVLGASPEFFEELVIKLLVAMGYGGSIEDAGQAVGRSGDGGIDGKIKEDRLGLDVIYIQAKRWQNAVGAPQLRDFAGSLDAEHARKGIFITTSTFTPQARDYVRSSPKRIVLIDGTELASLMFDHDVGVSQVATYARKRVDADFFAEE